MFTKKAITPIVATALLMTIAVLAVIGFQDWFQNFSTLTFRNLEQKTTNTETLKIDKIINNNLYLNTNSNTSINEISINGIICNKNINLKSGTQNIDLSICLKNLQEGKHTILIKTNQGIKEKYFYKKNEQFTDNSKEIITKSIGGLIGYWNFEDGIATDLSGNNNNGILREDTKIINGKAIFDGFSDYIEINHNNIFNQNSFTIIFKIKSDLFIRNSYLFSCGTPSLDKFLHIGRTDSINNMRFGFSSDDIDTNIINDLYNYDTNKYYELIFSWDNKTKERKFYLNSKLLKAQKSSGFLNVTTPTCKIGGYYDDKRTFNGSIDEIKIYNKALTDLEINSLTEEQFITETHKTLINIDFENLEDKDKFKCTNCEVENGYLKISQYDNFYSKELINVTPNCQYEISGDLKSLNNNLSKMYFGFRTSDKNNIMIYHNEVNYVNNTETKLYNNISIGDTIVNITNGSNWIKMDKIYLTFNTDNTGNLLDLPNRNQTIRNKIIDIIKKSDHYEIHLEIPLEKAIPKDTNIRLQYYGGAGSYLYSAIIGDYIPTTWTNYSGTATYEKDKYKRFHSQYSFGVGTEYVQILILANYQQTNGAQVAIDNIKIIETCYD